MKLIITLIATGLVFSAAGQKRTVTDAKKAESQKTTRTPDSPTIPRDATPLPDGSFRYVDKDGKKWIYRATPFGVSKSEERPAPPVAQIADDPARSEDLGDSVRFTRPTPFGAKVWTKKKSDLDSYEKNIWDRDQRKLSSTGSPNSGDAGGDAAKRTTAKQD